MTVCARSGPLAQQALRLRQSQGNASNSLETAPALLLGSSCVHGMTKGVGDVPMDALHEDSDSE